jgi:hypothetical protein
LKPDGYGGYKGSDNRGNSWRIRPDGRGGYRIKF